ncbi:MAG: hypothetical protein JRN20_02855 [Nitrososphaerota archaeon]|nr:hypothetical protein [Nitrososphaerota archaeon]
MSSWFEVDEIREHALIFLGLMAGGSLTAIVLVISFQTVFDTSFLFFNFILTELGASCRLAILSSFFFIMSINKGRKGEKMKIANLSIWTMFASGAFMLATLPMILFPFSLFAGIAILAIGVICLVYGYLVVE